MYTRKNATKVNTTIIFNNVPTESESISVTFCDNETLANHQTTYNNICKEMQQQFGQQGTSASDNASYRIEMRGTLRGKPLNQDFDYIKNYHHFLLMNALIVDVQNKLRR
jgi:hypothetical protein